MSKSDSLAPAAHRGPAGKAAGCVRGRGGYFAGAILILST